MTARQAYPRERLSRSGDKRSRIGRQPSPGPLDDAPGGRDLSEGRRLAGGGDALPARPLDDAAFPVQFDAIAVGRPLPGLSASHRGESEIAGVAQEDPDEAKTACGPVRATAGIATAPDASLNLTGSTRVIPKLPGARSSIPWARRIFAVAVAGPASEV
jgi:hypothetical protein